MGAKTAVERRSPSRNKEKKEEKKRKAEKSAEEVPAALMGTTGCR